MKDPTQVAAHAAQQEEEQQERELEVFDKINKQYASQQDERADSDELLSLVGSEDKTTSSSSYGSEDKTTSSSSSSSSTSSHAVASPSKRKRAATHDSA